MPGNASFSRFQSFVRHFSRISREVPPRKIGAHPGGFDFRQEKFNFSHFDPHDRQAFWPDRFVSL
jgi:hypothetical protein